MKIYIKTFGCQLNYSDSEVIAGILKQNGFDIVNNLNQADIIIINSCGAKSVTQNRILDFIKTIKNKEIFVGGCLPKMIKLKGVTGIFDTNTILELPEIIKNRYSKFSDKKENRLNKPKIRINKEIAIVPISQGCLGNCNYCSVKFARGSLKSYKPEDIIQEIKTALKEDCKKIYLTAQDTGCYGLDINTTLPSLLKEILNLKENFQLRLGMSNPHYIKKYKKQFIPIFKDKRIMPFLHIPVQSGSDKILKEMNRQYKIKDFIDTVNFFRKNISNMNIATDIIVGYPTETEQDFNKTYNLIKKIKPEVLNISKFGPRPKTEAAKLKQLHTKIIKERSKKLTYLFRDISHDNFKV